MNSKVVPALEVIIIPGYYSDPKMLKFNYTITNYDPTQLNIQLNFENPLYVSSLDDPDMLQINFNAFFFFFTEFGKTVATGTTLQRRLPIMLGS